MTKKTAQSGQVLLLIIMLLATAMTVVLTLTFKSRTDTQETKLEADSSKALTAAEAGVEKILQSNATSQQIPIKDIVTGTNVTGTATSTKGGGIFVSPLIQKDQQYTLYLSDYSNGSFSNTSAYTGAFNLYYDSQAQGCSAYMIEFTMIRSAGGVYQILRGKADPNNRFNSTSNDWTVTQTNTPIHDPLSDQNENFNCQVAIPSTAAINPSGATPLLMEVRILSFTSMPTKIGITDTNFPAQGRYVTSEATTASGTTKSIQVFQPYPQIPAEFFVTTF